VLDDNNTVSIGSRAVCYAKRPLEIWDRLGVAEPLRRQGRQLAGRQGVPRGHRVYQFDLLPEPATRCRR
jgi:3-(3-hydroxy-phenyl)propionate hydroxylase